MAKNLKMKSARASLDMSQQALAEAVGVSRQTINAIEKGDYNPTINLCIAICRTLGKTLDELFWEE
jgi:putative transcriptional regulator